MDEGGVAVIIIIDGLRSILFPSEGSAAAAIRKVVGNETTIHVLFLQPSVDALNNRFRALHLTDADELIDSGVPVHD